MGILISRSTLRNIKEGFLSWNTFKGQGGEHVRFWEDLWFGDKLFRDVYPNLYRIIRWKDDMLANILRISPLNVSFRR